MEVIIKNDGFRKLAEAAEQAKRNLPNELMIAVNSTAREMKTPISRQIREVLAAPAAVVKKVINQSRKASRDRLIAGVQVDHTKRIPLRDFGARQNKRGVSYRITKGGGRKTIASAFQGPKPGVIKVSWKGHVFKRVGKARLPIRKLKGPSPWGVFIKHNMAAKAAEEAERRLEKNIERRVETNVFKALNQ